MVASNDAGVRNDRDGAPPGADSIQPAVKVYLVYNNSRWLDTAGHWTPLIEDAAEYYAVREAFNAAQLTGVKTKVYVLGVERE